ncbi:hypothetical protein N8D74_06190 [Curtobacterium flaccumfaciens]|uniref:Uncharacterized protein n=1 Tax=Curtobacterium poinsettiae TaxID=159612 RepID=A0A9Q9P9Y1_9MICO|nr:MULTISPECIES: hypothetical protein [Curtobacterium]MCS6561526.1 hypothetical protein [Curtobacterium flaccumfaciens pv. poinsettiae]MDT0232694.1 hypothetical protein [Curtobacterium sp. BRB10]UXN26471.1 hypothetical protein N8D74_06190 [Curtobacterium flaccumfaciens]UXN29134.1 hypothetical protein N8D75_02155 [Curtobacterium flaccumfaciens]UYC81312.1 hypothetical protein OE229_02265 [Curtobacterium flaccumfaciens pv. poinsettiae]
MVVIWIVIAVVVVIGALLVVLEVQNRRRRRALEELDDLSGPWDGARATTDAEAAHSVTEGLAKSAHPGITGAGGGFPG